MDNKVKEQYEFLKETYVIAKSTLVFAKKLYCDYDENDNTTKDMQIILINALFHSAAVNICRILDNDANGLNIHNFISSYCVNTGNSITFMVDLAAVERLRKRRNKSLVHADKSILKPDFSEKFKLYIDDLDSILNSLKGLLISAAKEITGASLDADYNARQIEIRYDSFTNMLIKYDQMKEFMKQNHPNELLGILYSKKEDCGHE